VYLRRRESKGGHQYILFESYEDDGIWKHRELLSLGPEPDKYIVYPGGNSFYFKDGLIETLQEKGVAWTTDELEKLFMPFLDPHVRRIVRMFERSSSSRNRWKAYSREEMLKRQQKLHSFDKRRMHYLRAGQVNMGNLAARPWKFFNVLLEKSRDEIEALMEEMEQVLSPNEVRLYLYAALQLETHFRHLLTRNHPAALDPEKVDQYFLEDLCRLNQDERFFSGIEAHDSDSLHPYLVRYLILYFDHELATGSIWNGDVDDFTERHQAYHSSRSRKVHSEMEREACRCLGISVAEYDKMDRHALRRCYRKRAKQAHPDGGGDKAQFVSVKAAYERLLRTKS
jgi:hypothetical protein